MNAHLIVKTLLEADYAFGPVDPDDPLTDVKAVMLSIKADIRPAAKWALDEFMSRVDAECSTEAEAVELAHDIIEKAAGMFELADRVCDEEELRDAIKHIEDMLVHATTLRRAAGAFDKDEEYDDRIDYAERHEYGDDYGDNCHFGPRD